MALGRIASVCSGPERAAIIKALRAMVGDDSSEVRLAASISLLRCDEMDLRAELTLMERIASPAYSGTPCPAAPLRRILLSELLDALNERHERALHEALRSPLRLSRPLKSPEDARAEFARAEMELAGPVHVDTCLPSGFEIPLSTLLDRIVVGGHAWVLKSRTISVLPRKDAVNRWQERLNAKK